MSKTKAWIEAFRLRTLPLAFSVILMGAFLAATKGAFDEWILGLSLLTTLFLQILSNLANDYGDAGSGVDGDQREGPRRMVSSGLITKAEMKNGLILFSFLSLVSGVALLTVAFKEDWLTLSIFILIGLSAIAAAIKYTVGSNPYGYAGFGDLFVFIFFGLVGVFGSYYLYTNSFEWSVFLPATSCGLFSVGVLNVNNIRDIESDRKAGKNSVPVRIGRKAAVYYHWILLVLALSSSIVFVLKEVASSLEFLFLMVLPLLVINGRAVYLKSSPEKLDPYLRQLAITTLLYVLLFGFGQIYS